MKVFLIMIACLQSTITPLDKTCALIPMTETFETVPECLGFIEYFRQNVQSADPDFYVTGFCTTKEITSI